MTPDFTVVPGAVGELFWRIAQPVLIFERGVAIGANPVAAKLMGIEPQGSGDPLPDAAFRQLFGSATDELMRLARTEDAAELDDSDGSGRTFTASSWFLEGREAVMVVLLRDVTDERRHVAGLQHLNRVARELLAESTLGVVLQRVVDEAKALTSADFSALILLREGSLSEIQHFVYNAPRHLFPLRLPRVVGLLAVPIETGETACLDDIRGHPAGVGIPVAHPPIGALLAVPVRQGEAVIGELAISNTPEHRAFDQVDEALMNELAAQTAIAISLASVRDAQAEAGQAQRALTDIALHNIRTPVTVAMGFLDILRGQDDDTPERERTDSFDALSRALERIRTLSDEALLSSPDVTLPVPPAFDDVDPVALVDQLVAELRTTTSSVTLHRISDLADGFHFPGRSRVTHDLLENLVTNAIKHSDPGSTVTITVRTEGASVRFDVSDDGPGIRPAEQARIFEQFYRTAESEGAGISGTGLGLWIVKRLVTAHGGTVGVSSSPGQGSTFWLTFPINPAVGNQPS